MKSGNRSVKKRIKYPKCQFPLCQKQSVHYAHVSPTKLSGRGRGRNARFYDRKKNPYSYRAYCKEHHDFVDGRGQYGRK